MPFIAPPVKKKIWRFLNPHGVIVVVEEEKHYLETVGRRGFQFLGMEDSPPSGPEVPVVETKEKLIELIPDPLQCMDCEFMAKSEHSLKIHVSKMHRV